MLELRKKNNNIQHYHSLHKTESSRLKINVISSVQYHGKLLFCNDFHLLFSYIGYWIWHSKLQASIAVWKYNSLSPLLSYICYRFLAVEKLLYKYPVRYFAASTFYTKQFFSFVLHFVTGYYFNHTNTDTKTVNRRPSF